jgi:hypothetical protein
MLVQILTKKGLNLQGKLTAAVKALAEERAAATVTRLNFMVSSVANQVIERV